MREQARWTPDENNLRKCQMDPEKMIEQLTACGDWWDKFAKNLTSQGKRGAEETPFLPGGKKPKGGGQGGSYGASGSGFGNGGAQKENRPERGRPEHRDGSRRDGSRGGDRDGGRRRDNTPAPTSRVTTFGSDKEDKNPFELKWHTSPTFLPQHSIWVINSNHAKRQSLSAEGRCFLCKDKGHLARDCPQMENMYKDKKACYFKRK
jgi:hypothetical protein